VKNTVFLTQPIKGDTFTAKSTQMDRIECANCAHIVTAEGPCPNCGSSERMRLINLLARPEIRQSISMMVVAPMQIWTYLPAAIQAQLNAIASGANDWEGKGLCLSAVISIATLVEGVVTDYIENELETLPHEPSFKREAQQFLDGLESIGWGKKIKLIRKHFGSWKLEDLQSFDMIELLFEIRDQLAHGKSYKLVDRRVIKDDKWQRNGPISHTSKKYHEIYAKLSSRGILPPIEDHPDINFEMFLGPHVSDAFYQHSILFLRSLVKNIPFKSGFDMAGLLEIALQHGGAGEEKSGPL
jgi:hypothetical protein